MDKLGKASGLPQVDGSVPTDIICFQRIACSSSICTYSPHQVHCQVSTTTCHPGTPSQVPDVKDFLSNLHQNLHSLKQQPFHPECCSCSEKWQERLMGFPMGLAMCLIQCSLSRDSQGIDMGVERCLLHAFVYTKQDEIVMSSHCMKLEEGQASCCDTICLHAKHSALCLHDTR